MASHGSGTRWFTSPVLVELSQQQIENLSEEEYAFYLAFGTPDPFDLTWEEYERWLRSIQEFDV